MNYGPLADDTHFEALDTHFNLLAMAIPVLLDIICTPQLWRDTARFSDIRVEIGSEVGFHGCIKRGLFNTTANRSSY
jgi:hypothetical protein